MEVDGYMALSNVALDVGAGTLMRVVGPNRVGTPVASAPQRQAVVGSPGGGSPLSGLRPLGDTLIGT